MQYYNTVSEASRTIAVAMIKKPIWFARTNNYMRGFTTPFMVLFKDSQGKKVETVSTFPLWDFDVEGYLEETQGGYCINPSDYKFAYSLDYNSMHVATCMGGQPNVLGKWNKSHMPKPFVDGYPPEFYIDSGGGSIEVIFCNEEITSWEVIPNPDYDPSIYEDD
jgi:hypothetical protein